MYYTAILESMVDGARLRNDKKRTGMENRCLAREIVNVVTCEGAERVEQHEVFGKVKDQLHCCAMSAWPDFL